MKKLLLLLSLICIKQANGQNISTVAGGGNCGNQYCGDGGQATAAELHNPSGGVVFDTGGNMYIADFFNNCIRKINTSGIITTVAGNGTSGFSGDGGLATAAQLYHPTEIYVDGTGNIFIADYYNSLIRKVNTFGIITTVAGNGTAGFSGDGGLATTAELDFPTGLTLDAAGNIYIADWSNQRIRMVNTSGIISTIAGNGTQGFSGDGGLATAAELNFPSGVTLDASGNMYIADESNNRIRKVNVSGIITTIAGNGTQGFSGDGGQATSAELHNPCGIAFDASGNMYIADYNNNLIRMINTSGIINTIAGNGTAGFSGDGGLATAAELNQPSGIVLDASGNLLITDNNNNRIRMINNVAAINQVIEDNKQITISPNPTSDQFFIEANTTDKLTVDLYDVNGRHVFNQSVNDKSNINVATLNNGIYSLTIKMVDRVINKKLVIVH